MCLEYSVHAEKRLLQRSITKEQVEYVLEAPDVRHPDKDGNPCSIREVDGRTIRVVVARDDPYFIITVINLDGEEE